MWENRGTHHCGVKLLFLLFMLTAITSNGQRISTVQLDTSQYFISSLYPYSPRLNFHLAYQYCRTLGFQLLSLDTREKTEALSAYLRGAGYNSNEFWTSGNSLGSPMWIWMSTGQPYNSSFTYWNSNGPQKESLQCMAMSNTRGPRWISDDCNIAKEFICEQTRCFYYNYGSIPATAGSQG